MADAYYEAAHKGDIIPDFCTPVLVAKYININICHALKALDNSIYIVEGETEPNGKAVTNDYVPPTRLLKFLFSKKQNIFHMLKHLKRFLNRLKSSLSLIFKPE
ncbi:MAG: hypothetical protein ACLRWM_04710 [Streptococcus sp.]